MFDSTNSAICTYSAAARIRPSVASLFDKVIADSANDEMQAVWAAIHRCGRAFDICQDLCERYGIACAGKTHPTVTQPHIASALFTFVDNAAAAADAAIAKANDSHAAAKAAKLAAAQAAAADAAKAAEKAAKALEKAAKAADTAAIMAAAMAAAAAQADAAKAAADADAVAAEPDTISAEKAAEIAAKYANISTPTADTAACLDAVRLLREMVNYSTPAARHCRLA